MLPLLLSLLPIHAGEGATIQGEPTPAVAARESWDRSDLVRAGRMVPPGLPAARRAEREAARREALSRLAPFAHREPFVSALADGLADFSDERRWCTLARVASELGEFALGSEIAAGLSADRSPRVQQAARNALFGLYGRWFASPETFADAAGDVAASAGTLQLWSAWRARDREARESELALLRAAPAELALGELRDPDPRIRAEAARVAWQAVGEGELERAPVVEALEASLSSEADPHAFHAILQALAAASTGEDPEAEAVGRLRQVLDLRARVGETSVLLALAQALARLPWSADPSDGQASLAWALSLCGAMLDRLADDAEHDPDVVTGTLRVLESLCDQATGAAEGMARRSGVRTPVLEVFREARSDDVRAGAASALARVARPEDALELVAELAKERPAKELRFAILGALGRIAVTIEPGTEPAEAVRAALLAHVASPDADLRRRALELLLDPALESIARGGDVDVLVERLEREENGELRNLLLAGLRRFGSPEMLPEILGLGSFDRLASDDPTRIAELASTLRALAGDRPEARFAAARRLVSVRDPGTRYGRMERAVALVASLPAGRIDELEGEDHADVVRWSIELYDAGVDLGADLPASATFLRRLLEVHLPRAADGFDGPAASAGGARLAAELHSVDPAAIERAAVEERFAQALAAADRTGSSALARQVLRDRARFRASHEDVAGAREDFLALCERPGGIAGLDLSDLRSAAALAARVDPERPRGERAASSEARRAARRSWALSLELLSRPAWREEPPPQRVADLRAACDRAIETREPSAVAAVVAMLEDLPSQPPPRRAEGTADPPDDAPPAPPPNPPVWWGLASDPAYLEALREARGNAAAAASALRSEASPPPAAVAGDAEDPPPVPSEEPPPRDSRDSTDRS